ncbi:hypothetical protein D3C78_1678960 [compost metagenome]
MHLCDCNLNYGKNCLYPKDYETVGCNREDCPHESDYSDEDDFEIEDLYDEYPKMQSLELMLLKGGIDG